MLGGSTIIRNYVMYKSLDARWAFHFNALESWRNGVSARDAEPMISST